MSFRWLTRNLVLSSGDICRSASISPTKLYDNNSIINKASALGLMRGGHPISRNKFEQFEQNSPNTSRNCTKTTGAAFNLPANKSTKFCDFIVSTASGFAEGAPLPQEPLPFFKSRNQMPSSSPRRN
uniref:Uncharacterized protein n=1 Tax=Glossina austeni TaxID=7395 RepID=A0A1A9V8D8_GLOAU